MSRAREAYEQQMAELRDEETVARLLGEVIAEGLGADGGCVLLLRGGDWRPAYAFGARSLDGGHVVRAAELALGLGTLLHVAERFEVPSAAISELQLKEIVVVAAIESHAERLGLMLVGGRGGALAYTETELGFIRTAARHAAIGIRNTRLSEGLVAAERQATTGRIALSLAHDLGKELDWLRRLTLRLPTRVDDSRRLERDVEMIRDFAEGLVVQVKDFVRETATDALRPGFGACVEFLESAVRRMERIHGKGRIVQSLEPAVRRLACHDNLGRVVANLLDNALRASDAGESVHLYATLDEGYIRVVVTDRGRGLSGREHARAFDLGYSTRAQEGGLGVGLALSRDMVESLGGDIWLEPGPSLCGAQATVRFPVMLRDERERSIPGAV
jgi:signal transduction histidine kinase